MEETIVKNLIMNLKLKKMSTSDLAYAIDTNQRDLIDFYVKQGFKMKNADVINELYNKI